MPISDNHLLDLDIKSVPKRDNHSSQIENLAQLCVFFQIASLLQEFSVKKSRSTRWQRLNDGKADALECWKQELMFLLFVSKFLQWRVSHWVAMARTRTVRFAHDLDVCGCSDRKDLLYHELTKSGTSNGLATAYKLRIIPPTYLKGSKVLLPSVAACMT